KSTPKQLSRLGVVTKLILSTHRRRRPRICVVDQSSTHMRGKHFGSKQLHQTTHMRGGVTPDHAYAWKAHSSHVPESRLAHSKRELSKGSPNLATTPSSHV
ncbi:hypothetical protein PIB30_097953, partial [Stylosanthes scabra]|nr:hypothetical protein [Stylosanthes scabra]